MMTTLTYLINIIVYIAVLCIWVGIVFAAFNLKPNKYLPYGWIGIFFEKVLKPFSFKVWQILKYLSKVLLKWLLFTLEQFWYFLVEISRKFVELLYDVDG